MRDFDTERNKRVERDREFQIQGQTFAFRAAVEPERFAEYVALISGERDFAEAEAITVLDSTIEAFLLPEYVERWREVRGPGSDNPITSKDMHDIIAFMWGQATGRPTAPSSASGSGGESTGTTPTPGQSSLAAVN